MSRSSNSDNCSGPPSSASLRIAGARKAVIQSSPAGFRSCSIRALVIMPRSPTRTTRDNLNRAFNLSTCAASVAGIGGVAFEHFHRHRAAVAAHSKPNTICSLSVLAVAIMPEPRQFAGAALEIGRADVVEHQRAVLQVAPGQRLLDALLLLDQPVEGAVKLLSRRPRRARAPGPANRSPSPRRAGAPSPASRPARSSAQRSWRCTAPLPAWAAGRPATTADRARACARSQALPPHDHGAGCAASTTLRADRRHGVAAQHTAQRLDLRSLPIRQIGQRALTDLVAVAIALPQQDRGRRVAIGNALDVHGELES